jgi:hypothetical protein
LVEWLPAVWPALWPMLVLLLVIWAAGALFARWRPGGPPPPPPVATADRDV